MFVFAFSRESCIDPILLSSRVVAHVRVTYRRQFTGSRFGGMSRRIGAVDHDISVLVRQEVRSLRRHLTRRQIDCAGQVCVMIGGLWEGLYQTKLIFAINFLFQFVSGNCLYHRMPFLSSGRLFGTLFASTVAIQPAKTRVRVLRQKEENLYRRIQKNVTKSC
jgi:hypothetical protein